MTPDSGLTLLLMLCSALQVTSASGSFELQILSVNVSGSDLVGSCSLGRCGMYFRVCLKEYQVLVSATSPCSFGSASTPVLDRTSRGREEARLELPVSFTWPGSYSLIVEVLGFSDSSPNAGSVVVERALRSGTIRPGLQWQQLQHHGATVHFLFQVRLGCDPNYFGLGCNKFCRPRDDMFGHYDCDRHGNKRCRQGWSGAGCDTAVCSSDCSAEHGSCKTPGECRCQYGWRGERCDQCVPHPGCVHGSCVEPWQCLCDRNWGGHLCDRDLNLCASLRPCLNGATCSNTGPDKFQCSCPAGFSGERCERDERACRSTPCLHGGSCVETPEGFRCLCPTGWTGTTCSSSVCSLNRCSHGGTCVKVGDGFRCVCPPQWTGRTCRIDANECDSAPCIHAHSCRNLIGGYFCHCLPGWAGPNCDIDLRVCRGRCLNGATCQVAEEGSYRCVCAAGYSGERCEVDVDECASRPCMNGGSCYDNVNGFYCVCPPGASGSHCQWTDTGHMVTVASGGRANFSEAVAGVGVQTPQIDSDQPGTLLVSVAVVVWGLTAAVLLLWCLRGRSQLHTSTTSPPVNNTRHNNSITRGPDLLHDGVEFAREQLGHVKTLPQRPQEAPAWTLGAHTGLAKQ
ncbi:protein jagged-1-like isoform 2-T2 [Synchiropus picturatus]